MDGLIIRKQQVNLILSGKKNWEIRGQKINKRGTIALIQAGSCKVVGVCELIGCQALSIDDFQDNFDKHRASNEWYHRYETPHAWILKSAKSIEPQRYLHPQGAVIWVKNVIESIPIFDPVEYVWEEKLV